MESNHNKNVYTVHNNKDDIYNSYARTPCAQQLQPLRNKSQNQHLLTPYALPVTVSNNMSQQLLYNGQNQPVYNIMYGPQTLYRNQNTFTTNTLNTFTQSIDPIPWVPESCVTNSEVSPKDKLKENNSSYCAGRVDNISCSPLSDVYKTVNKNLYYNKSSFMDSHWFYGTNYDNQKYNEFPSCSQITSNTNNECCNSKDVNKTVKSVKYCSIQKYPEPDAKIFPYTNKYENNSDVFVNQQYNKIREYSSCSQITDIPQSCGLYTNNAGFTERDKKDISNQCAAALSCNIVQDNQGYFQTHEAHCTQTVLHFDVPKIDKTAEESNEGGGESDIVVEDSEEEVTDESEDTEKDSSQICVVCSTSTRENQFFLITTKTPITSFSQSPVLEKLTNILELNNNTSNRLCRTCMNLVDTIDNLEIQINAAKNDLICKYKTTFDNLKYCRNKIVLNSGSQQPKALQIKKRKLKLKDVCGIHSFKCTVCEKTFSLKKFYMFHMSKHKTKTKYLCEHCGCNFAKHSSLATHLKKHKNSIKASNVSQSKNFICHICGKIFKTKTNLKEHEYCCSGKLPFTCKLCNKSFPTSTKMKHHVLIKHDKIFSVACQICGKGFIKQSDMKAHLLTHSTTKNFKCNKCDKAYKTLSNLNYHLKIHDKKMPYNCSFCSKGFLRKENLESHINIHNGIKPFACNICDKKFTSQKNLDAHLKIHNGTVRRKTCPVCNKQISHGLSDHMQTHSTIKNFECEVCNMKFLTKSALAKHKKRKHDNIDVDVL